MVVPFVYTEEEYKELENELEYVRTIKDSAEKALKEVREENKKLKKRIKELEKICEWYEIENNIETMGNPIDPKILG